MPRVKAEKVLETVNGLETVEVEVAGGGDSKEKKTLQYKRPTVDAVARFLADLIVAESADPTFVNLFGTGDDAPKPQKDESGLAFVHRLVNSSLDRMVRMSAYESIAQESTEIQVGTEKIDILSFPVEDLLGGLNGMHANLQMRIKLAGGADNPEAVKAAEKSIKYGPWKSAARQLTEAKAIVFDESAKVFRLADGVDGTAKAEALIEA